MLIVFFRALILYAVVFLVIRLMGKRELSKVQPFELAIIILISDLASAPMSSRGISIFDGIVPIITLLVAYIIFTLIIQSSNKVQDVVCGTISVIIRDGKIVESELSKLQYTMSDIMNQLRNKDVFKVQDVKCAIIETNGNLTVIKNTDEMDFIPLNIIEEGKYSDVNMKILNMNTTDVDKLLSKKNIKLENVLVGTMDENSQFIYQLKDEVKENG
ncbi:MAG: DUF421 domain-containing protein [Clostridia bacterium]|nr:DUF421 domain-containing protein [Clostridia bacterium]